MESKLSAGIFQVHGGWSLNKSNLRWCSNPTYGSPGLSRKQLEYVLQLLENKYVNNLETPNPVLLLTESKNANERYSENYVSALMGKTHNTMQWRYFLNIIFYLFGKKNAKIWQEISYLWIQKFYTWESTIHEKLICLYSCWWEACFMKVNEILS